MAFQWHLLGPVRSLLTINAPLHYVYPCADVFCLAYALQRVLQKRQYIHTINTGCLQTAYDEEGEADKQQCEVDEFEFDIFLMERYDAVEERHNHASATYHRHHGYHRAFY